MPLKCRVESPSRLRLTVTLAPSSFSKGMVVLFSARRSSLISKSCEIASWAINPVSNRASGPSGVETRIDRLACVYVDIRIAPLI